MCGRFTQSADLKRMTERFKVEVPQQFEFRPRYNVAPSNPVAVISASGDAPRLEIMQWGIFRQWGKEKPPVFIINLQAEKLAKGSFKKALAMRRAIVPVDGFF